jgi:lysophospholipase L1-like esterase
MERKWLIPAAGLLGLTAIGIASALSGRKRAAGYHYNQPPVPAPTPPTMAPPVERPQLRPGNVLAIGNSMTAARGSYADVLAQLLQPYGGTVAKVARSGASTAWMREQALARLASDRPDTVIVLGGVNDGAGRGTIPNLRAIYRAAKGRGARVVALTELPWRGYARWLQAAQDRQDATRRWILAGGDGLIDVIIDTFTEFSDPARPGYLDPRYDSRDHLHPSAAGQRRLAVIVASRAFGL